MPESTEDKILNKIKNVRRGSLFFVENFINIATAKTSNKALERLVKAGELERLSTGIYYRPATSRLIGTLTPPLESVAAAIAKRDRARITPTGTYALNLLGLSTQVPMNLVYLTDGSARKIKIGKQSITFKKASPKNLAAKGKISSLVIQALKEIGRHKVLNKEIKHVQELLKNEDPALLQHDIRLAPAWIREIMLPALKHTDNE